METQSPPTAAKPRALPTIRPAQRAEPVCQVTREPDPSRARLDPSSERLLSFTAHELRNPLLTIRGLTEFLRDGAVGVLTPEQLNLVVTIHQTSAAALDLVNQMLEMASAAGARVQLHLERHDLGQLVSDSVRGIVLEAVRKRSVILFEPPLTAVKAVVDGPRIKQVVTNLLSNALKYSPVGSEIRATLSAEPEGGCCIAVRDQGPGLPEHERDRLFQVLGRLSVQPTGGETSTGLGLAISRKIVEAHGGSIAATNLPGGGCEFRVTLPSAPVAVGGATDVLWGVRGELPAELQPRPLKRREQPLSV